MRKLLDSRNDRDVLEGLRRVVAVRFLFFAVAHLCQTSADVAPDDVPKSKDLSLLLLGCQERRIAQH